MYTTWNECNQSENESKHDENESKQSGNQSNEPEKFHISEAWATRLCPNVASLLLVPIEHAKEL
jgi:hypothetical protein